MFHSPSAVYPDQPPSFPSPKPIWPHQKTTWLTLTITEGKFRQVRKMAAAIHHKRIRLIRTSIENLELGDLPAGGIKEITEAEFFEKLKLDANSRIKNQ